MSNGVIQEARQIVFCEGEFLVKELESEEELLQAYHLRHRVFAEKLQWVPERKDQLESDIYDAWSTSIGIFSSQQQLLGTVRMTPAPFPFMLESEFSGCLVGSHPVRKELDTAEITRLAVDPSIRDKGLSSRLMLSLIKGIYQWALVHDVRYFCLEVEHRFLRVLLALGIPCDPLGLPVAIPPAGALTVAATMDIVKCEKVLAQKRPQLMEWMAAMVMPDANVVSKVYESVP
jgi:acyl homoserine lactone synthase